LCLILPVGYSALFFLAPLLFLVVLGFWVVENYQIVPTFSLANYIDIAQHLFAQSNYGLAIAQSFYVALTTAVLAVLFCYPFVILYVTIVNIDRTLIEAARELGATRWQAFRRVILPLSSLGIVLSLSFATIISFGDVLSGSLLGGGAGKSALGSLPLFSNMI